MKREIAAAAFRRCRSCRKTVHKRFWDELLDTIDCLLQKPWSLAAFFSHFFHLLGGCNIRFIYSILGTTQDIDCSFRGSREVGGDGADSTDLFHDAPGPLADALTARRDFRTLQAHVYRGAFGAHVSMVLRRLLRLWAVNANDLGLPPQVCVQATAASVSEARFSSSAYCSYL